MNLKQILKQCEKSNHKDSIPVRSIKYGWDYCPYTNLSDKKLCKYQGEKKLVVKRWFYECRAVKDKPDKIDTDYFPKRFK